MCELPLLFPIFVKWMMVHCLQELQFMVVQNLAEWILTQIFLFSPGQLFMKTVQNMMIIINLLTVMVHNQTKCAMLLGFNHLRFHDDFFGVKFP